MVNNSNSSVINICSYNCNSVRKKVDIVGGLLNGCDILFLQEIILLNGDSDFIVGIDNCLTLLFSPVNVLTPNVLKAVLLAD